MSSDIFIGVDGGASSCRVRIEDASGKVLGSAKGGATTIKFSAEKAWATVLQTITEALVVAQINLDDQHYRFHVGCGLTGCELPEACAQFLQKKPAYFTTVCLRSDAYTACLGAHAGQDGAIIIVGTGSVGLQICDGETTQVSGWGFPHGDEGSGAWLGMEAVRLTLQWLDHRFQEPNTALLEIIFQKFDRDLTKLVVWANAANSTKFAEITPLIIQQLQQQDPLARSLIQRAAHEAERIGWALAQSASRGKILPCCLCGGLVQFIEPYLTAEFKKRMVACQHDAVYGAIALVKKNLCL